MELLLVLVLISIILVPLLGAIGSSLIASSDIQAVNLAANLAQAKLEALRNTAFDNLLSESKGPLSNHPSFQREVKVTLPEYNIKNVQVIVYWDVGGVEKSMTLETLIIK
jgi:Tfp pilus assembly protein FimT